MIIIFSNYIKFFDLLLITIILVNYYNYVSTIM